MITLKISLLAENQWKKKKVSRQRYTLESFKLDLAAMFKGRLPEHCRFVYLENETDWVELSSAEDMEDLLSLSKDTVKINIRLPFENPKPPAIIEQIPHIPVQPQNSKPKAPQKSNFQIGAEEVLKLLDIIEKQMKEDEKKQKGKQKEKGSKGLREIHEGEWGRERGEMPGSWGREELGAFWGKEMRMQQQVIGRIEAQIDVAQETVLQIVKVNPEAIEHFDQLYKLAKQKPYLTSQQLYSQYKKKTARPARK